MRTQRASALRITDLEKAAIVLAPQILPSVAGKKKGASPSTTAGIKKSTKANSSRGKKAVQQNKSVTKQKVAEKRAAMAMSPARTKNATKTLSPVVENSLPQLVIPDKASVVKAEDDVMPIVNAAFAAPISPILVMAEERPEPVALASEEIIADHRVPAQVEEEHALENPTQSIELDSSPAEKQTFLQALAFQCASLLRVLIRVWNWTHDKLKSHQVKKRLRVCETVSLGDKRFIAVIQVDGEQFLVGGSSSSVSTLAHLEPRREFSEVLRTHCGQDLSQA